MQNHPDADFGAPLRLNAGWAGASGRRKFHLVDWTGDGKLDLIINSGVNANLMVNISEEPGVFIFQDRGQLDNVPIVVHRSNPVIVDWYKDGISQLFVGGGVGFRAKNQNGIGSAG